MRRHAFSLLEVLIATVVIALAMAPLVFSLKTSTRSVTGQREMINAVAFAQSTLEGLRRAAFRPPAPQPGVPAGALPTVDELAAAMNATGPVDAAEKGNALTQNNVTMVRKVKLVPDTLPAGGVQPIVRVVQVQVTWKSSGSGMLGGENTYQLDSLLGSGNQP